MDYTSIGKNIKKYRLERADKLPLLTVEVFLNNLLIVSLNIHKSSPLHSVFHFLSGIIIMMYFHLIHSVTINKITSSNVGFPCFAGI